MDEIIPDGYECTLDNQACAIIDLNANNHSGWITIDLGSQIRLRTIIFLASHDNNWSY